MKKAVVLAGGLLLLVVGAGFALIWHMVSAPAPTAAAPAATTAPAGEPAVAVSADEVASAVEKGVRYIKSCQAADGSWPYAKPEHKLGAATLAVFALSEAGVGENDPAVAKGMDVLTSEPLKMNYDAACAALAAESVNPGKYIKVIAAARDLLVSGQDRQGMWTYAAADANKRGSDNSNTQFAILGLNAAMSVGLSVPADTISAAFEHYDKTQNTDGGWGYTPNTSSYGAMTAAGVGALHILGARVFVEKEVCGQYASDPRVAAGLAWLAKNYSVTTNPGGNQGYYHYYLYALERVGVFTGEKYIGGHDWYTEGARVLVDTQNADGSWSSGANVLPNTCFALLFLAKGNVPVLVNKLNYGGSWNVDVYDAENVTRYISSKFGQRVGWQSVTLDDSLETLLSAPILYVTGHDFPRMDAGRIAKMNAFFEAGGFMFIDNCCSKKETDAAVRDFAAAVFPETPLAALDKSHPIYRAFANVTGSERVFEGVHAGCRDVLLYTAKDISCAWNRNDVKRDEEAFEFGANIAAYITGKERLVPKLEQYKVLPSKKATTAPPGAFTFAQIVYASGTWNPHPAAGGKLLDYLHTKAGLTVASQPVTLPLTDKNLANYPFIYLTGCKRFQLTAEEKSALRDYINRGGFLFSDAACGRAEFDESFRALVAEVFGESPLEAVPADNPIYRIGFDTSRVTYTAAVRELNPNLTALALYGITVNGRIAVAYTPYDIGCALEEMPAYGTRGLVSEDAFKVAANVVLFALSH